MYIILIRVIGGIKIEIFSLTYCLLYNLCTTNTHYMLQSIGEFKPDVAIKICLSGVHPDSEKNCNEVTPLVMACYHFQAYRNNKKVDSEWLELIRLLLDKGANPNQYGCNIG